MNMKISLLMMVTTSMSMDKAKPPPFKPTRTTYNQNVCKGWNLDNLKYTLCEVIKNENI